MSCLSHRGLSSDLGEGIGTELSHTGKSDEALFVLYLKAGEDVADQNKQLSKNTMTENLPESQERDAVEICS